MPANRARGSAADNPKSQLFLLDLASGDVTQLTNFRYGAILPVWSPDGSQVAFAGVRDGAYGYYDIYLLDSAVYMGCWRKEAVNFMKTNEKALAARPVWLFSSGPLGKGDAAELAALAVLVAGYALASYALIGAPAFPPRCFRG